MTLWIAYATAGREFSAQEQCQALGYTCDVPRRVDLVRHAKRRTPDKVVRPFLPNYLFLHGGNDAFHAVKDIKEIRGTAMGVGDSEARRVKAFIARVEADFAARMAQIEAGERVSEYQPGDMLTLMTGPFAGQLARFRRMVEGAHDAFPQIEAELAISLMGRAVMATIDPINAKRVAAG